MSLGQEYRCRETQKLQIQLLSTFCLPHLRIDRIGRGQGIIYRLPNNPAGQNCTIFNMQFLLQKN